MDLTQPFIFDDFSAGMIDAQSVADSLMPRNAVRKSVNFVFDTPRGALAGRFGTTLVGNNLSTAIMGIHNFRDAGTGTNHRLLVTASAGTTYYLNGSSFTSTLTGDTAALKTRFVTYLDRVARINGTDAAKAWDGSSAWETTGGPLDVANWPARTNLAVVFNSRMYTAGDTSNPDTLFYSSIPSGGAISWTADNGFIEINPNDGENGITGLGTNGTVLLIFKRSSLYRWDGSSTFPNRVIPIGTPSNESIAAHDSGWVYFFGIGKSSVGVYRTSGGYPQKISLNISRWLEAIAVTNYSNVAGFVDDDHYYLSIGNVTVDDTVYTNTWLVYTISLQCWHVETHSTKFTVFAPYIDTSSNITVVAGDTVGNVQTINSGYTDNGTAISGECEFSRITFTTLARTKSFSRLSAYSSVWQGLKFLLGVNSAEYQELGAIQKDVQHYGLLNFKGKQPRGNEFYPKITFTNTQTPCVFEGFEFNEVKDEGYYQ